MKRLITIIMTLAGFICLNGQSHLPVLVYGDVYVGNTNVKSVGPLHVKPAPNNLAGVIYNSENGTIDVTGDSIIIYSDANFDGIILNKNTAANPVQAGKLTVRKTFTVADEAGEHLLSLPFTVEMNDVTSVQGSTTFFNQYFARVFDPDERAHSGNNRNNWKWVGDLNSSNKGYYGSRGETPKFHKGIAYRVGIQPNYFTGGSLAGTNPITYLDFTTSNADSIKLAFAYTDKTQPLRYYSYVEHWVVNNDPKSQYYNGGNPIPQWATDLSVGWNYIGGLSTAPFNVNRPSGWASMPVATEFDSSNGAYIWYYQQGVGYDYIPLANSARLAAPPATGAVISPFTPYYFQTNSASLQITPNHLRYDTARAKPANYRSSAVANADFDLLSLIVSNTSDPNVRENFEQILLYFGNQYSEKFSPGEDAQTLKAGEDLKDHPDPNRVFAWVVDDLVPSEIVRLITTSLPLVDNRTIKLGVNFPFAGTYRFELSAKIGDEVKSVVLVNKTSGEKVELMQSYYDIDIPESTSNESQFELIINGTDVLTGVGADANKAYAYATDGRIVVKNLSIGDNVRIVDIAGRPVAAGIATSSEFSATVGAQGAYIVTIKGEKPSVIKVLNR
jgi:hypothetical protein